MNLSLSMLFLLYLIYSIFGWTMEIIATYISTKKIVNRGFLVGPYCPIYGTGAIFIYLFLQKYQNDLIALFIMSTVLCSLVEYLAGYILEKLFNTRWWDYSNRKFNINGRVCLQNLAAFGLMGVIMIKIVNPFCIGLLSKIPDLTLNIIALVLFLIVLADYILSSIIIVKFKNMSKNTHCDSTEQVTQFVREEIMRRNKLLYNRIVKAFPKFEIIKIRFKND